MNKRTAETVGLEILCKAHLPGKPEYHYLTQCGDSKLYSINQKGSLEVNIKPEGVFVEYLRVIDTAAYESLKRRLNGRYTTLKEAITERGFEVREMEIAKETYLTISGKYESWGFSNIIEEIEILISQHELMMKRAV